MKGNQKKKSTKSLNHIILNNENQKEITKTLTRTSIQYIHDLKKEISSIIPSLGNKSIEQLENISVTAKYCELNEKSSVNTLYNLYVTYCQKIIANKNPQSQEDERKDLQLVALAALADIMPMKNENRIFVKNGILSMKKDLPRPGLAELFNRLKINLDELNSTVLSWQVIPALNAAGRLGKSNLSLQLLLSQDPKEREQLANTIFDLNEERKNLVSQAFFAVQDSAKQSFTENQNKLCLCYDECINKGVTGLVANKLMQDFNAPSIAISFCDDGKSEPICVGSIRTCRGFIATDFLEKFGDFFINHGGHDCAASFSFHKEKLPLFIKKTKTGRAMLALSEDRGAAQLMGINVNKIIMITFAIGSGLAAFASVFYLMQIPSTSPTLGSMPGIKAFTAAVIGGIGSIPGAMVGGLLIGVVEAISLTIPAIAPYTDAIEFLILIIILLVRPTGILGKKRREKV